MNGFSHFVHLALFFAGREAGAMARAEGVEAELWRAHAIESFDTAVVRARTVEGVKLWLGVSHAAAEPREVRLRVEGTQGAVEWRHESRVIVVKREGEAEERRALPDMDETRREMMACFLARVRDGEGFVAGTAMAINHLELIEAVHAVGEIREVPKARVRHVSWVKGGAVVIEGINAALEAAEARAGWLSEVEFPG
jgi:predicted dehydrogenase